MPRKNQRRRRKNQMTRYRRKVSRDKPYIVTIPRSVKIIPDQMNTVIQYSKQINLTGLAGNYYNFRGNSVYDPDESGAGLQPTGFDELMALYNQFVVNASSIKVHACNNITTGSAGNVYLTIFPTTQDFDTRLGIDQASTNAYARNKLLVPVSAGGNPAIMSNYMNSKKQFAKFSSNDQIYAGNDAANPNEQWYWHIEATPLDLAGNIDVWMQVTITYYVSFFDRRILPVS